LLDAAKKTTTILIPAPIRTTRLIRTCWGLRSAFNSTAAAVHQSFQSRKRKGPRRTPARCRPGLTHNPW